MSVAGGTGDPAYAPAPPPTSLRGASIAADIRALTKGRLGGNRTLIAFGAGFVAVIGISVAIVALVAPSRPQLCKPYTQCGAPPAALTPLVAKTLWRSSQFGFTLEYPGDIASVAQQSPDTLVLSLGGGRATVFVHGTRASQATPSRAVTNLLGSLTGVTQIATDPDAADQILGGGVGHRPGVGGAYVGSFTSSQGVSGTAGLAAEAATSGGVTIAILVVGSSSDALPGHGLFQMADGLVNSVDWSAA